MFDGCLWEGLPFRKHRVSLSQLGSCQGRQIPHKLTSELLEALARLLKALSEVGVQVCTTGDPAQIIVSYVWTVLFSG